MAAIASSLGAYSIADFTTAVFGRPLSLDDLFDLMPASASSQLAPDSTVEAASKLWVGSVGYERHRDSSEFAALLRRAGIERLIDVRELPISRRRGYAKTALADVLSREGIEYVHIKALGNPKPFRDLYKSGRVAEGRHAYRQLLLTERIDAVQALVPMLAEKRCALMCVEHDQEICHRSVIMQALENELGVHLDVAQVS